MTPCGETPVMETNVARCYVRLSRRLRKDEGESLLTRLQCRALQWAACLR
jgi:hypothetical protein